MLHHLGIGIHDGERLAILIPPGPQQQPLRAHRGLAGGDHGERHWPKRIRIMHLILPDEGRLPT